MATQKRSIAKTLTWRVIASATSFTVVYLVTGSITAAAIVEVFDFFLKMGLYYGHERLWSKIKWGKTL